MIELDRFDRLPPHDWLGSASAVALLTFDVDAESAILALDGRMARDLSAMSHQAYGPRVGIPRILELLRRHAVPATFFVPGVTARRWPGTVEAIAAEGHEIALHSHDHRSLLDLSADEQRADLEAGLAALSELGIVPVGYRAPFWRMTRETLLLLAEYGFAYDSSLMDDDRPYRLMLEEQGLAELPVHWSLDDWEQYAFLPEPDIGQNIELPSKAAELWCGELDAMRETQSLCVVTCHPFLSGRPSRLRALERFIEFAKSCGDVRIDRADAVARAALTATAEA